MSSWQSYRSVPDSLDEDSRRGRASSQGLIESSTDASSPSTRQAIRSRAPHRASSKGSVVLRQVLVASILVAIPFVALVVGIPLITRHGVKMGFTYGVIGGQLPTPIAAKAIDLVCSAILAPLLLLALNYTWFATARASVVHEDCSGQVSLLSLVELSGTSSGSYDVFKLRRLILTRRLRTFIFGLLVVLSAVAQTSFSNVIAYEAFDVNEPSTSVDIRTMNDFSLASVDHTYDFTADDETLFKRQVTTTILGLSFDNAAGNLQDGHYVGINATQESLYNLPTSVRELYDVPAYRLVLDCDAVAPSAATIWDRDYVGSDFIITLNGFENATLGTALGVDYQSVNSSLTNGPQALLLNNGYDRLQNSELFGSDVTTAFLSLTVPLQEIQNNCSALTLDSSFGDLVFAQVLSPLHSNMGNFTIPPGGDTNIISCIAGLQCSVSRGSGTHTLQRDAQSSWEIKSSNWSSTSTPIHLILVDWQTLLGLTIPTAIYGHFNLPGFGSALASTSLDSNPGGSGLITDGRFNWQTYSANFLYAVGEADRIAYEIQNSSISTPNAANNTISVSASQSKQYYRITYVPIILLAGLLSTFFAASIVLSFMLSSLRTESLQQSRVVDPLRLLTDALVGLSAETERLRLIDDDGKAIKTWAENIGVRYEKDSSDRHEGVQLHLHAVERSTHSFLNRWKRNKRTSKYDRGSDVSSTTDTQLLQVRLVK